MAVMTFKLHNGIANLNPKIKGRDQHVAAAAAQAELDSGIMVLMGVMHDVKLCNVFMNLNTKINGRDKRVAAAA
jgi:hypothetical protein